MALYDLVTVGGGVGGAALAKAMAEQGHRVLVIEREKQFKDRVRGEFVFPWVLRRRGNWAFTKPSSRLAGISHRGSAILAPVGCEGLVLGPRRDNHGDSRRPSHNRIVRSARWAALATNSRTAVSVSCVSRRADARKTPRYSVDCRADQHTVCAP
jgi:choline dehydrogenase-like flavoprotein